MLHDAADAEILGLTHRLLKSIADCDWEAYTALCDPSLACFEPEARGQLVEGLAFHRFYFNLDRGSRPVHTTICAPHVRMLGEDAAVVSYVRLTQSLDANDAPRTSRVEETRVWQRQNGAWRHVHFHRSTSE
jgi:calcium/calmodulin-dependent protein kinase (CaM kinase) II